MADVLAPAVVGEVPAPRTAPVPDVTDLQRRLDASRSRVQAQQARLDPALTERARAAVAPDHPHP